MINLRTSTATRADAGCPFYLGAARKTPYTKSFFVQTTGRIPAYAITSTPDIRVIPSSPAVYSTFDAHTP